MVGRSPGRHDRPGSTRLVPPAGADLRPGWCVTGYRSRWPARCGAAGRLGATSSQVVLAARQALRRLTGHTDLVLGGYADRGVAAAGGRVLRGHRAGAAADRRRRVSRRGHRVSGRVPGRHRPSGRAAGPDRGDARGARTRAALPLVQVLFNSYHFGQAPLALPDVSAEPLPVRPRLPFGLTYRWAGRHLVLELLTTGTCTPVGSPGSYDLVALLTALVDDPDQPVGKPTMMFRTDTVADRPAVATVAGAPAARAGGQVTRRRACPMSRPPPPSG